MGANRIYQGFTNKIQNTENPEDRFLMPSEIAKTTGLRTTQISNALSDMKEKNLVICMNESAHKGRLYQNTELGLEILERLDREE